MTDFCNRSAPACPFNADTCSQYSEPSAKLSTPNTNTAATSDVCIACHVPSMPCLDPCDYSPTIRVVITMTTLRNPEGSTPQEILQQHNAMCVDVQLTQEEVDVVLSAGRSRGIFLGLASGRWMVKADFPTLPSNIKLLKEVGRNYLKCLDLIC